MSKARRTSSSDPSNEGFAERWNALDAKERKRIRRLVRVGRKVETPEEAQLAVGYATHARAGHFWRWFWVWFLPLMVLALGASLQIHPILVGIVLALGANAVFVHVNEKRAEKVNASLL